MPPCGQLHSRMFVVESLPPYILNISTKIIVESLPPYVSVECVDVGCFCLHVLLLVEQRQALVQLKRRQGIGRSMGNTEQASEVD